MDKLTDLDRARLKMPELMSMKIHKERGFAFLYPEAWHRFTFDAGSGPGVLFAEQANDFGTHVSLEVQDLATPVTADDLPELEKGFLAGLRKVPKSKLLSHTRFEISPMVGLEAHQSFDEVGLRRRRWVRLLYAGRLQARLVAQAADEATWETWRVKFEPIVSSFDFGDEAWPTS